jgi:hypothetical protein
MRQANSIASSVFEVRYFFPFFIVLNTFPLGIILKNNAYGKGGKRIELITMFLFFSHHKNIT